MWTSTWGAWWGSVAVVLLGACSASSDPSGDASLAEAGPTMDASAGPLSQSVGPAGGVLFGSGVTFTVPPGALAAATTIIITRTDLPIPAGYVGYSPVWRFAPEGLTFAQPARIDLASTGDASRAAVYWSRPTGGYERLAGSVLGDHVVASVTHFSTGFAGDESGSDAGAPADVTADVGVSDAPLDASIPLDLGAADVPLVDVTGADTGPALDAPRPVFPLTGAHSASRRPTLRWALPTGVTGARVSLCRDRALTLGCVSFDAAGASGAPSADLAAGVWFWGLRGLAGGAAGGTHGAVWRLRVPTATLVAGRPWGGDPDVNGDGFADVITAARGGDGLVYLGGPSGPATVPVRLAVPADSTGFATALDFAGDVDGDGYGDVLVGAPGSETAYVYRGGAAGPVATPQELTGPHGSQFATAVVGAGDVNGDGFGDLVVTGPGAGALFFFPGGAAGPGAAVRVATDVAQRPTAVGDVDGDGYADVLGGGSGQIFRGGPDGLLAGRTYAASGEAAGDLNGDGVADLASVVPPRVHLGAAGGAGTDVALAGGLLTLRRTGDADFNGDGYSDLVLDQDDGTITVVPGGAAGPTAATPSFLDGYGTASFANAAGAGDVDGDGADELLSGGSPVTAGASLYLTRGSPAGLRVGPGVRSVASPVLGLAQTAAAGDVDHDGRADAVVATYRGGIALFRGTATGFAPAPLALVFPMTSFGRSYAGLSAVGAGDVDGDGFGDLAVAATDPATTRVYYGAATGGLRATFATLSADGAAAWGAGDVNGDHFADVLAGLGPRPALFRGAAAGVATAPTNFGGTYAQGTVATAAGDVNHDGYGDVLVQPPAGGALVFAGSAAGLGGAALATLPAGTAVAVGDVNGDGFADLAVWTSAHDVTFHHGGASGPSATPALRLSSDDLPVAVGDVNHDGFADVSLQGDLASRGIYFGSALGLPARPSLVWPDGASYVPAVGLGRRASATSTATARSTSCRATAARWSTCN